MEGEAGRVRPGRQKHRGVVVSFTKLMTLHEQTVGSYVVFSVGALLALAALTWWAKGRLASRTNRRGRRY
jgi:hypothetical protein